MLLSNPYDLFHEAEKLHENVQSIEALKLINKAVEMVPENNRFKVLKGVILLSLEQFDEGFPLMDLWHDNVGNYDRYLKERWNGKISEGSVIVWDDQGFGDCIFYLRYVPYVKKLVPVMWLSVHEPLKNLVQQSFPEITMIGPPINQEGGVKFVAPRRARKMCPISTIPLFSKLTIEKIPYLNVPDQVKSEGKIGVCWESGRDWSNHDMKSVPYELIRPMIRKHRLVSLAKKDLMVKDFLGTAKIIQGLDLIITVDTAVAHLAGALGKPVWLMLSRSCDWRWGQYRDDNPWYPTMRLFRQKVQGDWSHVLQSIAKEL